MKRKLFDVLASLIGVAMVIVLVVAGGLLMRGHSFANSNVKNQLTEQGITFPARAAFAQAFLMAVMVAFGFWHAGKTEDAQELEVHKSQAPKVLVGV